MVDQNISVGKGGILFSEIASALYGLTDRPPVLLSFIGGLGGRRFRPGEFDTMLAWLQRPGISLKKWLSPFCFLLPMSAGKSDASFQSRKKEKRFMKREHYKSLRTISHEEPLGPGGPLCAGCGGLLCLRLFHKALGENVIFVNAAGCFTLLASYPFTPLRSSWIYTAMACAPAGAQGIRDALDILKDKGKLAPEDDRKVVVLTGDGAAQDIGLQSTMAAIHRGLDFYYLCYDNEAYGNTGFQTSASTPYGSRTATCPITLRRPTVICMSGAICLKSGVYKGHLTWRLSRRLTRWISPRKSTARRNSKAPSSSSP